MRTIALTPGKTEITKTASSQKECRGPADCDRTILTTNKTRPTRSSDCQLHSNKICAHSFMASSSLGESNRGQTLSGLQFRRGLAREKKPTHRIPALQGASTRASAPCRGSLSLDRYGCVRLRGA